jgi:hypothetical protein
MNRDAANSATFVLRSPDEYTNMERMNTTAKWHHKWCWAFFEVPNKSLTEPNGPPGQENWMALGDRDAESGCAFEHNRELRALGLTGRQVTTHFLKHCLAPYDAAHPQHGC